MKNGIKPVYISIVAAAALCFDNPNDEAAVRIQESLTAQGLKETLKEFSGLCSENDVVEMISYFHNMISKKAKIEDILAVAERTKEKGISLF